MSINILVYGSGNSYFLIGYVVMDVFVFGVFVVLLRLVFNF